MFLTMTMYLGSCIIRLSVLSNNSWRTRPHFIAGELLPELLQTDRTGTATAIFFPTINSQSHKSTLFYTSVNIPVSQCAIKYVSKAASCRGSWAETERQYSLSGRQVAIPVACQYRDCIRQLGIPSCVAQISRLGRSQDVVQQLFSDLSYWNIAKKKIMQTEAELQPFNVHTLVTHLVNVFSLTQMYD